MPSPSIFGLGKITPQGYALNDLRDVNVSNLSGRHNNKDFVLRWKNEKKKYK